MLTNSRALSMTIATALLMLSAGQSTAHTSGIIGGFGSGFLHPIGGLDHVVAMVAVGMWVGLLGRPVPWPLPLPLTMAASGLRRRQVLNSAGWRL